MEKELMREMMKGVMAVFVGMLLCLVPFSFLFGWNLVTLLLFWFAIVPWVAHYMPTKVSQRKNHLLESLVGLGIFYAFMVFLIYDHYQSDYFFIMMVSCVVNLIVVSAISLSKNRRAQTA